MPSKSRQTFSGLLSRFMPAAHGFVEPRQLVVRNQPAGVFHQIAPNRERPGLQRNLRAFSPQTFVRRIERETAEPLPGKSDPSAGTMRPPAALCRRISQRDACNLKKGSKRHGKPACTSSPCRSSGPPACRRSFCGGHMSQPGIRNPGPGSSRRTVLRSTGTFAHRAGLL
jgi:hypothetical protein